MLHEPQLKSTASQSASIFQYNIDLRGAERFKALISQILGMTVPVLIAAANLKEDSPTAKF